MKVGDPVTLLVSAYRQPLQHGYVQNLGFLSSAPALGAFSILWGDERYQARRLLTNEGIDWIRGHPAHDSEACLALRAANALTREAPDTNENP